MYNQGIRDIAKSPGLGAIAINMEGITGFYPAGKIRQDAVIGFLHPWAIDIEGPDRIGLGAVLSVINITKRLTDPFAFIITGARSLAGYITSVAFPHWHMLGVRIAINLAR